MNKTLWNRRPPPLRRQGGMLALGLALVLLALVAGLLAGTFKSRLPGAAGATLAQVTVAERAMKDVDAFFFMNGSGPCPAATPDGGMNCGGTKGWYPTRDLRTSTPVVVPNEGQEVYYALLALNGAPSAGVRDLAVAEDNYQPLLADASQAVGPPAYGTVKSSVDLCAKLAAMATGGGATRWELNPTSTPQETQFLHVADAGGAGVVNVAYAVMVSPAGAGPTQHGVNRDAARNQVESPQRAMGPDYTDTVSVRTISELGEQLKCPAVLASINALAVAQQRPTASVGERAGNIAAGIYLEKLVSQFVASAGLAVLADSADTLIAAQTTAENEAMAMTYFATGNIPMGMWHLYGGFKGVTGLVFSIISLANDSVDFAFNTAYLGAVVDLKNTAENSRVWEDGTPVLMAADRRGAGNALQE